MPILSRILIWLGIAAICTAATIVIHEIAHYLGAVSMGAAQVRLHWADVTFDEGSLDDAGLAVTWLAGPVATQLIILWAWLSRSASVLVLGLGLGACTRNFLILPFTIKLTLGRDTSTFTNDEVSVAEALGVSPLPFALLAVVLGVGGAVAFLRRAGRAAGAAYPIALVAGVVLGIVGWTLIGPVVLPGGRGVG